MGISAKWLRSLVGLRKVERQQRHRKEDADVGVGPGRVEAHPESNKRVPVIVDALEKLEFSPKVLEIQNFNPTSLDDVARVHSRSYITGLEKAMGRASDEGLIFIERTGPTYATETVMLYTFQESLLSAGARITLVDSVILTFTMAMGHPMHFMMIQTYSSSQLTSLEATLVVLRSMKSDSVMVKAMTLILPLPGGTGDYAMRCAFDEVISPSAHRNKPDLLRNELAATNTEVRRE